jgi:hypothetical protein
MSKGIRSGKEASESMVAPSDIHWPAVVGLQIWAIQHDGTRKLKAPGGLDIRWIETAGVRYTIAVIFEDDTWVWTDMTADPDAAVAAIQRLAAQHDKPIQRSGQSDDDLRKRGY